MGSVPSVRAGQKGPLPAVPSAETIASAVPVVVGLIDKGKLEGGAAAKVTAPTLVLLTVTSFARFHVSWYERYFRCLQVSYNTGYHRYFSIGIHIFADRLVVPLTVSVKMERIRYI